MSSSEPITIAGPDAVPVYVTRVDTYDQIPTRTISTFTIAVAITPPNDFAPAVKATEEGSSTVAGFVLPAGSYITTSGIVFVATVPDGSKVKLETVLAALFVSLSTLLRAHQKASGRPLRVDDALAADRATDRVGKAVRAAWATAAKRWPDALVA